MRIVLDEQKCNIYIGLSDQLTTDPGLMRMFTIAAKIVYKNTFSKYLATQNVF